MKTPMPAKRQLPMYQMAEEGPKVLKRRDGIAAYGDADARGQSWYSDTRFSEEQSYSGLDTSGSLSSLDISTDSKEKDKQVTHSDKGSSDETNELELKKQRYRQCVSCPEDMLKKYTNVGINWICGAYQRARRTFKSECMMRYRNCQDGTSDVVFALSTSSLTEVANSLTPAHASALLQRRRSGRMRIDQWLAARRTHVARSKATDIPRSTSSDSDNKKDEDTIEDTEFPMSNSGDDSHGSHNGQRNKYWPVSTEERKGWRKWHRKCKPCPDVLHKQWSDPTIEWICGAYQRARRTFKSECMMHHRNCQDGTMFVKIYDRRCKDDETGRFGAHFFYEYDVKSTEEKDGEASNMNEELSTYEEERRALKRRAGVSVPSVRTTNSSIAMDPQNASNNVTTTNVNILTEVVNPTSKILQIKRYSRKVRDGNARRLTSNSTSAYYRNKVVKDFATYNHHSSRSAKLKSVANVTRRMYSYNGGLDKAIRAVSNFGLSLLEFTAHYNSVGHTELAVQHLKPQKNKHNRITTDHVKSTSPNFSSPRTTLVHSYPSSP